MMSSNPLLRSHWRAALVVLLVCVMACAGRTTRLEGPIAGDTPVAFTNLTRDPISSVSMSNLGQEMFLALGGRGDPILPGQTARFSVRPGTYGIVLSTGTAVVLDLRATMISGPVQFVVHEGERPPADLVRLSGFEVKTFERADRIAADRAAIRANLQRTARDHALAECKRTVAIPAPAPGRTRASGRWHCVYGGNVYAGSDYVDLVQLADGRVTATVTGVDRNNTWDGSVVGDEVHFRWNGADASGATLKLDPSGRAMLGQGHTFTDGGECLPWTLTCTR